MPKLRELHLRQAAYLDREAVRDRELGARGLALLLASPLATTLRFLDLDGNALGDEGAAVLADAHMPELRTLHVRDAGIRAAGAAALARATGLPRLRELDLSENPIDEAGALAWAETTLPRLVQLALHDVSTGQRATNALKRRFGNGLAKESTR